MAWYIVISFISSIIDVAAEELCSFYSYYYNDVKYKFCSSSCCYDQCCYAYYGYYSNYDTPVGAIVGITIGCLVGLGLSIGCCVFVVKICCKSPAPQAGQVIGSPQVTYVHSQGNVGGLVQTANVSHGYPGVHNPAFSYRQDMSAPPPAYEVALQCSTPTNTGISNDSVSTTVVDNTGGFTDISVSTDTSSHTALPPSAPDM